MSELSEAEREDLEALGYTEAWLSSGILDRKLLAEQLARLRGGGSQNQGKYRAKTLATWIGAPGPLHDAQLDTFLAILASDGDAKVVQGALSALIQSPRLSLEQLEKVARADPKLIRRHEGLIRRTYLARRMEDGISDELLAQVIESRDAAIQTGLIRDPRLSRKQAEKLAKQGANPTIRTNAQAWFQDKKAWA